MREKNPSQDIVQLTYEKECMLAELAADRIMLYLPIEHKLRIFPIKRGGVPAAYLIALYLGRIYDIEFVEGPENADVIIDDLVDTGYTKDWYKKHYPGTMFVTLLEHKDESTWIEFTWEQASYLHPPVKHIN